MPVTQASRAPPAPLDGPGPHMAGHPEKAYRALMSMEDADVLENLSETEAPVEL